MEYVCNIINAFTVIFDQFNALLNKSINFFSNGTFCRCKRAKCSVGKIHKIQRAVLLVVEYTGCYRYSRKKIPRSR